MTPLEEEIENNRQVFFKGWTKALSENSANLGNNAAFVGSYRRLSCLNAIQNGLISKEFSTGSAAFFVEAQNDALVSHINASVGSWRSALQSLRSSIENVLSSFYYSSHPVELELWSDGKFRIGFQELHKFLSTHPRIRKINANTSGLTDLKSEYETLSKAVHASAISFRMTGGQDKVSLWSTDQGKLSAWSTRERKVIEAVCALTSCFFVDDLQGAKNQTLRTMLQFVIRSSRRTAFRTDLKINL